MSQRTELQNMLRRVKSHYNSQELLAQKQELTKQISALRKQIKTAIEVEARSERLKHNLTVVKQIEAIKPQKDKRDYER